MNLRRALFITALIWPAAAGPALAQFPPAQQQEPPCFKEFNKLRNETETRGKAIKAASDRKAPPQEACKLFNAFTAAEATMIKYITENGTWCGIPPQVLQQLRASHVKANEIRTKVCRVAAAPPPPSGPTLSDALSPAIPDAGNIKSGHGTYDTLTGTPLGTR